jgi:hypothetical protein
MFFELSGAEKDVAYRCLQSALNGDLFPLEESKYHIGMSEADLRRVLASYPRIEDMRYEADGFLALDLCLSLASVARSSGPLALVPESSAEINRIRMKAVGAK